MVTARKRKPPVLTNRETFDAWVATFAPMASERLAVLIRLGRSLADEMDSGEWTAPIAREFRVTLDVLGAALREEDSDDGQDAFVVALRSAVGNGKVA